MPSIPTVKVQFLPGSFLSESPSHLPPCCGPASFLEGPVAWRPGPLALICSAMSLNGNQVMGDASRPSSVLLAAVGEWSLAAIGRRTSREAGEAGAVGRGGGWEGRALLCWAREERRVKGYFKAGIAACPLSLRKAGSDNMTHHAQGRWRQRPRLACPGGEGVLQGEGGPKAMGRGSAPPLFRGASRPRLVRLDQASNMGTVYIYM